jgi:hypothetical protein
MTTPLSRYLANAMVPIKERIPIRRMTSKKPVLLINTEKTATPDIILIPNVSRA